MVRRGTTVVLVALALVVATLAYGVVTVDRPRVESVDSEWGTVTDERTEVETRITIDDPQLLRIGDAAANVSHTVSANDVVLASERDNRVQLAGNESTVAVSTWLDNDEIPTWWVSHVNENETTDVRIEPDVTVDYAGVSVPADPLAIDRTVRTNLLEPLRTTQRQQVRAYNQTVLIVEETDAHWGTATANRTPIDAEATVTNPMEIPVPIAEIEYTVRLNGITVGEGVAAQQTVIEPNSTTTIDAAADLDTTKLDEWWVTHLRRNETSNLSVDFTATLEYGGLERDVPLEFLSYDRTFETDLLGTADAEAAVRYEPRDP